MHLLLQTKQEELIGLTNEVYRHDTTDKGLDLVCVTPSNRMEDVDSCSEMSMGSSRAEKINHIASERKSQYRNQRRSGGVVGDVESCAGTPRNMGIDASLGGSSRSPSLFANEVDADDHSRDGCSVSCCWSGTPKFKRSIALSDVEDRPLLVEDVNEANRYGWRDICRDDESTLYSNIQKRLGQRSKPKSFDELVGQDVVAKSLTRFYIYRKNTLRISLPWASWHWQDFCFESTCCCTKLPYVEGARTMWILQRMHSSLFWMKQRR